MTYRITLLAEYTKLSEVQAAGHETGQAGEKGLADGMVRAERLPKQRTKEA